MARARLYLRGRSATIRVSVNFVISYKYHDALQECYTAMRASDEGDVHIRRGINEDLRDRG
jgi:hypothetical protein